MTGGGGDGPPSGNGGQFLLQLLQNPPHHPSTPQPPAQPSESPSLDPAVAAVGPTIAFPSPSLFPPSSNNLYGHPQPSPWSHHHQSPPQPHQFPFAPHIFFPQNPSPNAAFLSSSPPGFNQIHQHNLQLDYTPLNDDIGRSGFLGTNPKPSSANQHDQNILFGSLHIENRNFGSSSNGNMKETSAQVGKSEGLYGSNRDLVLRNARGFNGLDVKPQYPFDGNRDLHGNVGGLRAGEQEGSSGSGGWGKQQGHVGSHRAVVPPPGFNSKSSTGGNRDKVGKRRSFEQNVDKGKSSSGVLNYRVTNFNGRDKREGKSTNNNRENDGDVQKDRGLISQLKNPGPPSGSHLNSVRVSDFEESLMKLHAVEDERRDESRAPEKMGKSGHHFQGELEDLEEQLVDSLGLDDGNEGGNGKGKGKGSRDKDYRSDKRGQWILNQRMRMMKRRTECRRDINRLNAPFLAIFESLIPSEEEKAKQDKLLAMLDCFCKNEWPGAQLYVYGSCANSFGFSKSDIDICLAIQNLDITKSEVLLKLAEILEENNFQNVQALTRARVPIVKLMDPVTGISCDICINNVLAVVNTKLLRDYALIDERLRQLAFIVKHWAKTRGVNETYQGTLSSYAYVLMCINFLQQRRPAILPCLQGMEATYSVTVENLECAYFNQIEKLHGFGARNGETIAQLVWSFFNYWAYGHDYANDVISVRMGCTLSKRDKDWTRRIGNDRHLICIEDPFETSHDLGRVVDRSSIRVLREEFERAAEIMQFDANPCAKLFEPYIPN